MSKTGKLRNSERRKREKASRKAANRARYQKWAEDGINYKLKKSSGKTGRNPATKGMHVGVHDCGNPACKRCNPIVHA